MDSLHFCIAVVPLSVYLLMMGLLNLRRHPFVTTGARDAATLGIGVVGFVIAGPMELFFPEGAASQFGAWVWLSLIVFYGLCVSLVVLLMRPRLVVYNVALEELRPILSKIAMELAQEPMDWRCLGYSKIEDPYARGSCRVVAELSLIHI